MKEEKKSVGTKKISTTKKTSVKKTTTKKTNTKSSGAVKKVSETKKNVSAKPSTKSTQKKVSAIVEKTKQDKVETPKVEVNKEELNKELLLRMILIIAYTLIISFLIMGFVESMIKSFDFHSPQSNSYIVQEKIVADDHIIDIRDALKNLRKVDGDYFIYLGYTKRNNSEIQIFERDMAKLIDKYDLKSKFYYVNIDAVIDYDNSIELINKYLGYTDVLISKVPTIAYINKEHIIRIENIITRSDSNLITIGDFQNLLDINQFVAKK